MVNRNARSVYVKKYVPKVGAQKFTIRTNILSGIGQEGTNGE